MTCRRCGRPLGWPDDQRNGVHLATCWRDELRESGAMHPGVEVAPGATGWGRRRGRCSRCGVENVATWQDRAVDWWLCDDCLELQRRQARLSPVWGGSGALQDQADALEASETRPLGRL